MYKIYTRNPGVAMPCLQKILLTMRLTTVIMILTLMQVNAKGLAQRITMNHENVSLEKVFKEMRRQTGYDFLFNVDAIRQNKKVNAQFKNSTLQDALTQCLEGSSLTYSIEEKTVIIKRKSHSFMDKVAGLFAVIDVEGQVLDTLGQPLVGAVVFIENHKTVSRTNEKGYFKLVGVPQDAVLLINFLGYSIQKVKVTKEFMTIVMRQNSLDLKTVEVYNTGYQVLDKERVTGAFSKADMAIVSKRSSSMDLISRLDGLVPGLVISRGTNAVTANINGNGIATQKSTIRGIGTFNKAQATEPIYSLNGVIVNDFSSLNLDDIAEISVLKDAAASAIYGARSANGVIVVTTKSGTKQARPKISYSGFINFRGKPDFKYAPVLNSKEYIQTVKEIFDPVAFPLSNFFDGYIAPHETILYNLKAGKVTQIQADKSLDSLSSINNMDQIEKLLYRNAFTNNHTVSASGGSNLYSFYASAGFTQEHNNKPGSLNNTYRLNFTQTINPSDRVKISLNASLINNNSASTADLNIGNTFLPYQLFQDVAGNAINMRYMTGLVEDVLQSYEQDSKINFDYYPLNELGYSKFNSNLTAVNITANGSVKLWRGLSFQGTYGYQKTPGSSTGYTDNRSLSLRKRLIYFTVPASVPGGSPTYAIPRNGGDYRTGNNDQRNWTVRNQFIYQAKPANGRDNLSVQVGQEANETYGFRTSNTVMGYDEALGTFSLIDYQSLNTRGVPGSIGGLVYLLPSPYSIEQSKTRFTSYFGLANYTYKGLYSVDASLRKDKSNLFGSNISSQNKPAWSIGGRWKISGESFMKSVKWLNDLSLRTTYGITGNSPYGGAASQYDVVRGFSGSDVFGGVSGDFLTISSVANRNLYWERTENINIGLNFAVLNNRIGGSIDLYKRNTTELIGVLPVHPLTGGTSITGNVGHMLNNGIEVGITTENIRGKDFSWTSNIAFAYNRNKLLKLTMPDIYSNAATYSAGSQIVAGRPMQALFAYRYAGLDNLGDPQIFLNDGTITKKNNAAKAEDLKYMGTTVPVFNGGLSNTFRYRGISLSANMVYSLGNVMRRDVNRLYTGRLAPDGFRLANISPSFLDRWKKPGDEAFTAIPSYVSLGKINGSRRNTEYYTLADINVTSASYVKLRDLTLSYEFSPRILKALNITAISVFGQSTGFMIWKANKYGIDPEYNDLDNGIRNIPSFNHSYTLGLNFTL